MARPRFEQLPPERQAEILRVAAEEFAKSGFQGTSYNQLLERLKLGKSSAYYYFENKRDLFLTAITHCYQRYFEKLAALPSPANADDFWRVVEAASVMGFDFMLEDPTAAKLLQCMQRERDLTSELLSNDVSSGMIAFYEHVLAEGIQLGAVRDDLPAALLTPLLMNLSLTFDQWFIATTTAPEFAGSSRAARLYTDLFRRLAGARVSSTAR